MLLDCFLDFQGCDKEIPFEEIQNTVFYEITSQSPNTILHIDATGLEEPIYIRSKFSNRCRTKNHLPFLKFLVATLSYILLTGKGIEFNETMDCFTVKIPLIYESFNH